MELRPFKAITYKDDLQKLTSPPFDGITPEQEKELKKNPYNITHLTLPEGKEGVLQSKGLISSWLNEGVLNQVDKETLYVLVQEFRLNGEKIDRIGVIGITDTYPDKGVIKPHERTFPGVVMERSTLMRALEAQLEPLFLTVLNNNFERVLKRTISGLPPDRIFEEPFGVRNSVYYITDKEKIKKISETVEKDNAIVADGHHRLKASQTIAGKSKGNERKFWSQSLVYVSSIYDRGLLISGVHRLVNSDYFIGANAEILADLFSLRDRTTVDTLDSITIYDGSFKDLIPRQNSLKSLFGEKFLREDVVGSSVVNDLLFTKILGMTEKDLESSVRYTHDVSVAIRSVDQGKFGFAVLMPTWNKDSFIKQAMSGKVLPQKSTYFYPKIPSGIALRKFSEN